MTLVYAALAILGAFVPLGAFLPWVSVNGADPLRFVADLFANRVSSFFALDVIVSAIAVAVFVLVQGARWRPASVDRDRRDVCRGRIMRVAAVPRLARDASPGLLRRVGND